MFSRRSSVLLATCMVVFCSAFLVACAPVQGLSTSTQLSDSLLQTKEYCEHIGERAGTNQFAKVAGTLDAIPLSVRFSGFLKSTYPAKSRLSGQIVNVLTEEAVPGTVYLGEMDSIGGVYVIAPKTVLQTDSNGRFVVESSISQNDCLIAATDGFYAVVYHIGKTHS